MNPVLAEVLKWIVAGALIFFGTWIFYTVVKARNSTFKSQVAKAGNGTRNYSRSKPLLLIIAIIVIILIWLMEQQGVG